MSAREYNFDGLVGLTHSYAGLGVGNLASQKNRQSVSHPRAAALQGLAKMRRMMELGIPQGVLPPQERPDLRALRRLGFTGSDAQVLEKAYREAPHLLAACCSASAMWAANAATVSPSTDSADGRVHFTPANLVSQLHRSIETDRTARILKAIFRDPVRFVHHDPLPAAATFGDEGAANHTRFWSEDGAAGVQLFVYGRDSAGAAPPVPSPPYSGERVRVRGAAETQTVGSENRPDARKPLTPALSPEYGGEGGSVSTFDGAIADQRPQQYPARQTFEASAAVARLHQLSPDRTLFARQHPAAIDAGVFHNDVIAVGNLDVLLCHELAFADREQVYEQLRACFHAAAGRELRIVEAKAEELPLADVVASYVFNSQLVSPVDGQMVLVAPTECQAFPSVQRYIARLQDEAVVGRVEFVDVRQSMRNGGGPACLRLRIPLTDDEAAAVAPGVILTDALATKLEAWITRHYRESLSADDLADPRLLHECRSALKELCDVLGLGNLYLFQEEK